MNSKNRRWYLRHMERFYGEQATQLLATAKLLGDPHIEVENSSLVPLFEYANFRTRATKPRSTEAVRADLLKALHEKHQRQTSEYQALRSSAGITQTRSHNPRGLRL